MSEQRIHSESTSRTESDRMQKVFCRHCGRLRTGNRPRNLCWTCYYTPSVRDAYPPAGSLTVGPDSRTEPVPAAGYFEDPSGPCPFPPGSEGKIDRMVGRVLGGHNLFHPDDQDFSYPGERR